MVDTEPSFLHRALHFFQRQRALQAKKEDEVPHGFIGDTGRFHREGLVTRHSPRLAPPNPRTLAPMVPRQPRANPDVSHTSNNPHNDHRPDYSRDIHGHRDYATLTHSLTRSPQSYLSPPRSESQHRPKSYRSYEADDEWSDNDQQEMGPSSPRGMYDGEDTRPTSSKELRGFYVFGWASEVFVVCGMGSFIPITLEQLARERGFLASDRSIPCTAGLENHGPGHNGTFNGTNPSNPANDAAQCVVTLLGVDINTASFAMYTFSLSVLVQALVIISMSGAADHGHYRKSFLITFALLGAVATMLFLPTTPTVLVLGSLFAIISNTCFGATTVLLNSFLPLLVRNHPSLTETAAPHSPDGSEFATYRRAHEDALGRLPKNDDDNDDDEEVNSHNLETSTSALLHPNARRVPYHDSRSATDELKLSARISANGVGIGYLAAFIVQVLAIIVIRALGSSLFSLRLVVFIIGVWWAIFTIPAALWLRPRPGPPLASIDEGKGKLSTAATYIGYSWRALFRTLTRAGKLRDVLQFLAAWFLLSDGIATISGTAILFAKTSLSMKPAALAVINIVVTISGIIGAIVWRRVSVMMQLTPIHTIALCVCILEIIPLYGLLGYIPAIQRLGMFGLQQPWEMYPLGAVYGFVLGGLSSFCRSLFGEIIPPGFEAAFYALYAITDKGSSIFGPAVVGAIIDATGEIRPAFFFLAALIGIPLPILLYVNTDRGRKDGIAMAKELQQRDQHRSNNTSNLDDHRTSAEDEDGDEGRDGVMHS